MSQMSVLSSWLRREENQELRFLNSEDEDDEKANIEPSENEKILKQMTKYQEIQLDNLHKTKFETKFTGDPKNTIPYLFKVDMFFKVQMINNPTVRFSTIFQTLPIKYREEFMIENSDKDDYTIHDLFDWIINTFPPPRSKFEFELTLKSITMRKAENPLNVYKRLQTIYSYIEKAINLINKGITNEKQKLLPFTNEFKADILSGIFIRKNDKVKFDNDHVLNKMVRKHCLKWSSHTMDDWKEIIKQFNTIVKDVLSGDRKYQYTSYPPSTTENDIYFFHNNRHKSRSNSTKQPQFIKRKSFDRKRRQFGRNHNQRQNYKRQRISCLKCGRNGHVKRECRSTHHVNGQRLRRNNDITCHRCHRPGHKKDVCFAKFDKDGKQIPGKPPAQPPSHYKSSSGTRKQFNSFKKYEPSKNPENIRQRKELRAEQERRNKKFGVFNFEVDDFNKFSQADKEQLERINEYTVNLCQQHDVPIPNGSSPRRNQ